MVKHKYHLNSVDLKMLRMLTKIQTWLVSVQRPMVEVSLLKIYITHYRPTFWIVPNDWNISFILHILFDFLDLLTLGGVFPSLSLIMFACKSVPEWSILFKNLVKGAFIWHHSQAIYSKEAYLQDGIDSNLHWWVVYDVGVFNYRFVWFVTHVLKNKILLCTW